MCCGSRLQVVALTSDGGGGGSVELVRCTACGRNTWRLDGQDVDKGRALGALSAAFAPAVPRPPRPTAGRVTAAPVPAAVAEPAYSEPINAEPINAEPINAEPINAEPIAAEPIKTGPSNGELAALLSGWRVLGSHG
jgi:hypothetical protein